MDPKGEYAQTIFNLSWPVFLIAGVVGVIVFAIIGVAHRPLPGAPGHEEFTPKQVHGKPAMEIGLTVLPAVLLAAISGAHGQACSSTSTPNRRMRWSSTSPGSSGGGSSTTRRSPVTTAFRSSRPTRW